MMSIIVLRQFYFILSLVTFLLFNSTNALSKQDVTYISSPIEMKSPGYPRGYGDNLDLKTVITNPSGCVTIVFLDLSLENTINPVIRCINDYLEISEVEVNRKNRYCGDILPQEPYVSKTHTVNVTFHTDNNVTLRGYSTQLFFQPCMKYSWTKEKWSDCSVTCGEGVMTRRPLCKASNKKIVGPGNCNISKLPKFRKSCILTPCGTTDTGNPKDQKTPIKTVKDDTKMDTQEEDLRKVYSKEDIKKMPHKRGPGESSEDRRNRNEQSAATLEKYMSAFQLLCAIFFATAFLFGFLGKNGMIKNIVEDVDGTKENNGKEKKEGDDSSIKQKKDE
ncbi:uncharacterized protein [Antedon mediterranea]|uniref:uncharacterized protein n=1 Tax=Antedon mediterranea TaxID=105859 RepID=UPI003AF60D7F